MENRLRRCPSRAPDGQTTEASALERGYRRWMRCYPRKFRQEHEAEILAVLMACAREGQRRPDPMECLDLVGSALRMRLRPTVSRSDRSLFNAVRLMYLGALVELAAAITILATSENVRARVTERNPGYTLAQWQAEVGGKLQPLAVAAGIAMVLWLWIAWLNGRGHRWARILPLVFSALNIFSLFQGLGVGSAVYAGADLAIGIVLCLVGLAAVGFVFHKDLRKIAGAAGGLRVVRRLPARVLPGARGAAAARALPWRAPSCLCLGSVPARPPVRARPRGGSPGTSRHRTHGSPGRHAAHTMWMSQPCSQVCMAGTSTPYDGGAKRLVYPAGYPPELGRDWTGDD